MVNVIIPAYNAHDTIRQALASVGMQDSLSEIFVTIVDDCSEQPYDYLLNEFPYISINIIKKTQNDGCGPSRQVGIDNCKCDYLMFLDADDCLINPNAIIGLQQEIINENADVVISDFYEELDNGDYLVHEKDDVWMHGKLFRTKFLKDNNIRFSNTRANEDHAFNIIVSMCGAKRIHVEYITYVWKYNPNSIMRKTNAYIAYIDQFIENAKYTLNELTSRQISQQNIARVLGQYIVTMYGYYNLFKFNNYPNDFVNSYVTDVQNFIAYTVALNTEFTSDICVNVFYSNTLIKKMIDEMFIFSVSLYDFFKIIGIDTHRT